MDERERTLNERARALADAIRDALPDDVGFTLFLFHYGLPSKGHFLSYISTAPREDMVATIKDWIAHQEGRAVAGPTTKQ